MNIERVNQVLNSAIVSLQESEIDGLVEKATVGSYSIPSPVQMGFGYRPKSPKAMGYKKPETKKVDLKTWTPKEQAYFAKMAVKDLKKLKKDVKSIRSLKTSSGVRGADVEIYFKGDNDVFPSVRISIEQDILEYRGTHRKRESLRFTKHSVLGKVYKWVLSRVKRDSKDDHGDFYRFVDDLGRKLRGSLQSDVPGVADVLEIRSGYDTPYRVFGVNFRSDFDNGVVRGAEITVNIKYIQVQGGKVNMSENLKGSFDVGKAYKFILKHMKKIRDERRMK